MKNSQMFDFAEKRDFQRMTLDSSLEYKLRNDDQAYQGLIKNLSATGLLFVADRSIPLGITLQVKLSPENTITPPMAAEARVTRCDKHADGGYYLACEITQIQD